MKKTVTLELSPFELGILWGLTMSDDVSMPEGLRSKIHDLVNKVWEYQHGEVEE